MALAAVAVITPGEVNAMFRGRVAELASNPATPPTPEQLHLLALQVGTVARALTEVVTALHRGLAPVATATTEVLVDLGRQLTPHPAPDIEHPRER